MHIEVFFITITVAIFSTENLFSALRDEPKKSDKKIILSGIVDGLRGESMKLVNNDLVRMLA